MIIFLLRSLWFAERGVEVTRVRPTANHFCNNDKPVLPRGGKVCNFIVLDIFMTALVISNIDVAISGRVVDSALGSTSFKIA